MPNGLNGNSRGPWCAAYQKTKDRTVCREKKCMFYQNRRVTDDSNISPGNADPDYDDNLNAISVKKPVVRIGRQKYTMHEDTEYHCVLYDEPSHLETLPWDE